MSEKDGPPPGDPPENLFESPEVPETTNISTPPPPTLKVISDLMQGIETTSTNTEKRAKVGDPEASPTLRLSKLPKTTGIQTTEIQTTGGTANSGTTETSKEQVTTDNMDTTETSQVTTATPQPKLPNSKSNTRIPDIRYYSLSINTNPPEGKGKQPETRNLVLPTPDTV